MGDLIVATRPPTLADPRGRRGAAIVRALLAHGPVGLVYVADGDADPWFARQDGLTPHPVDPAVRGARRRAARMRARALGVPAPFLSDAATALARAAEDAMGDGRVIADGPAAAAALLGVARDRPVIYDAPRLHSFEPPRDMPLRARRELRSFERGLLAEAAETWLESVADLVDAEELCSDVEPRVVAGAIDLAAIAPEPAQPGAHALAVGDFRRPGDRVGLELLIEAALPAIWAAHPDIALIALGPDADAVCPDATDPRIRRHATAEPVLGWPTAALGPLRERLPEAGCLIAPALDADDDPLRLAELLAHGLPVVATEPAASELGALGGVHHVQATPTRAGLALAIVDALQADTSAEIGALGRELVERERSTAQLARQLAP